MARVVTFGEIMLRLAPEGYYRFIQAEKFGVTYGGGEANVAVSLANYGVDASFVTKLPRHEIGQAAVNSLRRFGVDTSNIVRGGDRIGIYFLEKGASQRPSKVIYDRVNSAIACASPDDFNWKAIFQGPSGPASWFHWTGISPALGDTPAAIVKEACAAAKEAGLTVSCDLNYRKNLWSKEKAGNVMEGLMPYVDVCIANEEDAADVFGIRAKGSDAVSGRLDREGYKDAAKQLADRFHFKQVAITLRESLSANDNNWGAMLYDGKEFYFSEKYAVHIVDRVGGGDSFGAGIIYGNLQGYSCRETLDFATAASCLKHSIEGDFNLAGAEEVKKLSGGDASGRVQR
jgi:2-dehydro-3-deoxygluconokinase